MDNVQTMIDAATNIEVLNSILVTDNKLKRCRSAVCSVSGGSDSDIVLDLCAKLDTDKKVTYVFFDTGLEFQATKDHIKDLQEKYGIEIVTAKAVKPIPTCCREFGVPFLSKQVSEWIQRLQRYNFKWEDRPFDELILEYPKCKSSLKWWCNEWDPTEKGRNSKFNISYNTWLKEFMIANPPTFKISNKCCKYAKKLVAQRFKDEGGFDLSISGVRKAEKGARQSAYKNCFTPAKDDGIDEYRPVFWYKNETKNEYKEKFGVVYSDCYEVWGLPRTGCSGCPYAFDLEAELRAVEQYEPKLHKALYKVFGESYEYTRKYREFQKQMRGG